MDKCPVCKSDAEELDAGLFDGYAIKCPTHGEIEFSDSVRVERWDNVQIPTHSGQVFRIDAGRDSDLMPATVPN